MPPQMNILPSYSEEAREDTLLHYTTANGLLGILQNNEIWSTAYHCLNDESELHAGKGVLTTLFREKTYELIQANDSRIRTFSRRGIDPLEYAEGFEQMLLSLALDRLSVYITCLCKPTTQENFYHGLLSQWRAYGSDGGYALQFSRAKLRNSIEDAKKAHGVSYSLEDVHYSSENPLREALLTHADAFTTAYIRYLDTLVALDFKKGRIRSPIADLPGEATVKFLDFLIYTKNEHFAEENECRMSVVQPVASDLAKLPVKYFNRDGLVVPYASTPFAFDVRSGIEWIIVGPGPRIESRVNSVRQMVRSLELGIKVRASGIPLSRT